VRIAFLAWLREPRLFSAPAAKDIGSCQFATFVGAKRCAPAKGFCGSPWGAICFPPARIDFSLALFAPMAARYSSKGVALVSPSIRRSCFN